MIELKIIFDSANECPHLNGINILFKILLGQRLRAMRAREQ